MATTAQRLSPSSMNRGPHVRKRATPPAAIRGRWNSGIDVLKNCNMPIERLKSKQDARCPHKLRANDGWNIRKRAA